MDNNNYKICSICGSIHYGPCATAETTFIWQPIDNHIPKKVMIAGSWRQWQTFDQLTQETDKFGEIFFRISIMLLTGTYEYKYIIDGQWKVDPREPITENINGVCNNFIKIRPLKMFVPINKKGQIKITTGNLIYQGLKIVGSWDNWAQEIPMNKVQNHLKDCLQYVGYVQVEPDKEYQFCFKLKKQWLIDQHYPSIPNGFGGYNNIIITESSQSQEFYKSTANTPLKHNKISKAFVPKNFQWVTITRSFQLPYKRVEGHSMNCIGDDIYIFGGICRRQFYSSLTKVNFKFTSARTEQCWPNGRAFHNSITYGNKIIIFGGHNKKVLQDYYSFNVTEQKWAAVPQIAGKYPCKKQKQSCVLYSILMVFFGGYYCSPDFQCEEYYKEISVLDIENMRWIDHIEVQGQQPVGRCAHTANLIQTEMFIFGGTFNLDQNLNLNDIWKINLEDVNKLTWIQLQPKGKKPCPRHGHSMNTLNNYLILFGGLNNQKQMLNDLFVYDINANQWFQPAIKGEIPRPRYYHASTTLPNDNIVIFGGNTKQKKTIQNIYLLKPIQFILPLDISQQQDNQQNN